LPDCLRSNEKLRAIVNLAQRRRIEESIRRDVAGYRVRAFEENLRISRQELLAADKDLRKVEISIEALREIVQQAAMSIGYPSLVESTPAIMAMKAHITNPESFTLDALDDASSDCSCSNHSESAAAG
jgi:hypothetical protein